MLRLLHAEDLALLNPCSVDLKSAPPVLGQLDRKWGMPVNYDSGWGWG